MDTVARGHEDPRSIRELTRRLATQSGELVRKEIALARLELTEALGVIRSAAVSTVVGGVFAFGGFLMLLVSAVLGINVWLRTPWLSALIVGASACILGAVVVLAARRMLRSDALVPDRSAESLRRDGHLVQRGAHRAAAGNGGPHGGTEKEIAWQRHDASR